MTITDARVGIRNGEFKEGKPEKREARVFPTEEEKFRKGRFFISGKYGRKSFYILSVFM